jgi:mono/diheme cytochrome c family protein
MPPSFSDHHHRHEDRSPGRKQNVPDGIGDGIAKSGNIAPGLILDGAQSVTTPRAPNKGSMPAYAAKMSDQQIADVTTFIRNAWGNAASAVSAAQVAKARRTK